MSEKEKTISSLVLRLAMTGLVVGVAIGALAAFRGNEADAIVATAESLYWILAIILPVQLFFVIVKRWRFWRDLLNADTGETVGLLIVSSIFGAALAGAVFMIPVVSLASLLRQIGPWEILPGLHAALSWWGYGVVVVATAITAGGLAVWLYRSAEARSDA